LSRRPVVIHVGLAALGGALLLVSAGARVQRTDIERLLIGWRGWDDLALAVGEQQQREFPVAPYRITDRTQRDHEDFIAFRDQLKARIAGNSIRPSQFWRTLGEPWLSVEEWPVAQRFDDSGRAVLLGFGFRLLGGTAPYLLPWLGVLAAAAALGWVVAEMSASGSWIGGIVFAVVVSSSAFVVDVLMVGYAAAGFQLVALLAVAAVATYGAIGSPVMRGTLWRAVIVATTIAACAACRSATLLLLPGLVLALIVATARAAASAGMSVRRRVLAAAGVSAASVALCLAAYQGVVAWTEMRLAATAARHQMNRPLPQAHDVWITLWQGLGDFDRTKGHVYLDQAGERAVLDAGGHHRLGRRSEALLRRAIFADVREDPVWFAAILARRVWATVTLWKLWPRAREGGTSIVPAQSPNEGVTDSYYTMIAQADWIAMGSEHLELPAGALLWPTVALVGFALAPVRALGPARTLARRALLALLSVAVAALATPVLITTGSGFETQMFVVVHLLALGFAAEVVARLVRRRDPGQFDSAAPAPRGAGVGSRSRWTRNTE
jgi:hypothetical protein